MSEELFSPSWYRVAALKPRLRSHIRIHQHNYRGEVWYVLQDTVTNRQHRFSSVAFHVIQLMDGQRSVETIWNSVLSQLGDDAPTQGELIQLFAQLHAIDALQTDITPDTTELFRRYQQSERRKLTQRLMTPLSIRLPLLDPDSFLTRHLPLVRPLFSWWGTVVWLVVVVLGALLAAMHWRELPHDITAQVLTPWNLLILWLVYPLVKILHEFGHAFATKRWGGEVHEMGVLFLVFMPVPYVEASAASVFSDKWQRIIVGGAGMMVELFLAALALMVWLNVEPGIMRTIAFNVMLIGGVSSLLFNGNPLLRFDGYYMLADLLEIPNLASRSRHYLSYLIEHHLFKMDDAADQTTSRTERAWLLGYSVLSYLYRVFILFGIALFVAGKFFIVGVLLALWTVATQLLLPIFKLGRYVLTDERLAARRTRAVASSLGVLGLLLLLLFALPLPLATNTEGVVWLPEQARVRTATSCFVRSVAAPRDSRVEPGQPLLYCDDPGLRANADELRARLDEYEVRFAAETVVDRVKAEIIQEDLKTIRAELSRAEEKLQQLDIKAQVAGSFVVPNYDDLVGRFLPQGAVIAYVIEPQLLRVRAVVGQEDIDLVRQRTERIELRLVSQLAELVSASIHQAVPSAVEQLPSAALGVPYGGIFLVDPSDEDKLRTLNKVFQIDLLPSTQLPVNAIGARVYVRFSHANEPVGFRLIRLFRQLLMRKFDV